jgi:hypothetical protein
MAPGLNAKLALVRNGIGFRRSSGTVGRVFSAARPEALRDAETDHLYDAMIRITPHFERFGIRT